MTREYAIEVLKKNRPRTDPRRCGLELCTALDMAIAALREQPQWISVKNQKPEYKKQVLFVDENKRVWLAKDSVDWPDGVVSFLEPESGLWVRGTHWMPLPEPPKEEV